MASEKWTVKMDDNRKKALAAALGQIEKQFGKGSVMRLGDGAGIPDIEAVSTGSIGLDVALGIGGLPRGRVVEIYGPEASGKTTLTLQVIAEAQKLGGTAAFIDAMVAADKDFDLLVFPGERHGYRSPKARRYAYRRVVDYFANNL